MRLIFVRHGEPDYVKDCLTPTGEKQAEAGAKRLAYEGIEEIYSSPNGRAFQTASYTAKELGLPITVLDYMHEITWGGEGLPENGHPWMLSDRMIFEEGFDFYREDWKKHPYFANNAATRDYEYVTSQFDLLMEKLGYKHEGNHFLCTAEEDKTVALFSHGGSGGSVLANLLGLPMPYVFTVMPYEFVSIIILNFPVMPGKYVFPRLEVFNDTNHTKGISNGLVLQQESIDFK